MTDLGGVTPAEASSLATDAASLWETGRDVRMREDQRAWEMQARRLHKRTTRVPSNDVATTIDKGVALASQADLIIEEIPGAEEDRDIAQRIENAERWAIDEFDARHRLSMRGPIKLEAASFALSRGWLTAVRLWNPGDLQFPWRLKLVDPIQVYPDTTDGEPTLYAHRYTATYRQIESYWGKEVLREALDLVESDDTWHRLGNHPATCTALYTRTHMGILLEAGGGGGTGTRGRGWLKKPVNHGYNFNPMLCCIGPGAAYRDVAETGGQLTGLDETLSSEDFTRYIGTSLVRTLRDVAHHKQDMLAMIRRMFELTAAPPLVYQALSREQDLSEFDQFGEPNSHITVQQGETINPLPPPAQALNSGTAILTALQDMANRAGFGPALYGLASQPGGSGFDRQLALGTSLDVLDPYMDLLRSFWEGVLVGWKALFKRFGVAPVQFVATDPLTGLRSAANLLDPIEVLVADTRTRVKFGELGTQDMQARTMIAAQLLDRGIVDHEYVLSDILKVENPMAVMRRAKRDQALKDPMFLRLAAFYEKAQDPTDPMAPIAQQMVQMLMQQFAQEMAQAMMGPPPSVGQQPGMAPSQPPLPNSGVPSAALPPELGLNAGLPPGLAQMGAPQAGAGMPPILPY
jgi:hypothetical protein